MPWRRVLNSRLAIVLMIGAAAFSGAHLAGAADTGVKLCVMGSTLMSVNPPAGCLTNQTTLTVAGTGATGPTGPLVSLEPSDSPGLPGLQGPRARRE
jgi:hypothetical protein